MELKRCTKCGENKPNTNEYFAFQIKSKGTLKDSCKVCDKKYRENNKDKIKEYMKEYGKNNKDSLTEYRKKYYENNKEYMKEYMKNYYENTKDKRKEYMKEYGKNYYENNKDKRKEYMKEYRENTKDKRKEYMKEYREANKDKIKEYRKNNRDKLLEYTHKRRALKLGNGGSYTKSQWLDTLEYFDYKCAYTGECIKHGCHVEHIVPVSKGGTSYIWNLVPSTESANLSKGNKTMEEWYREQEYFCEERLNKIYEYQKYMAAKYK